MNNLWTGEKVRLRAIEPRDWSAFQRFDEHSGYQREVERVAPPRSAEGYRRWAAEEAVREADGDRILLAVEATAEGSLVGLIEVTEARPGDGVFGYAVRIGPQHQQRGYGRDAVLVLLRFMFTERRYTKCTVGVFAGNSGSIRMQESLGFTQEGRIRRHRFAGGDHEDLLYFGMTVEEFQQRWGG